MSDGQPLRQGGRPIMILSEDSERSHGRDARTANIAAGKAVAESVRTTLGPEGMDKMLVSDAGDVVITNDGATILKEMDIEHPAAQMLVEVAESQEADVGDGTTTAAVLAGELLSKAETFIERDLHPTTVTEGYATARDIALEAIEEATLDVEVDDDVLRAVATSAMTGKGTGGVTVDRLTTAIVDAIRHVEDDDGIHRDDIHVRTQKGESSSATELVEGVIADLDPVRDDMPRQVDDATVALVDMDLEQPETSIDVEYNVNDVTQLTEARDSENRTLREYADAIVSANVDVAFVTGDVAPVTGELLSRNGVLVFESVGSSDADAIARATGAKRVGALDDLEDDDLGHADAVTVERFEDEDLVFVEGGSAANSVTLFVRGGTDHVVDELERAITDGVDAAVAAAESGVVPGAGAVETHIAAVLRDRAAGIEGRKQLAVEAFADAVESIPRTLAENTGLDPIDTLADLRAGNQEGWAGVLARSADGAIGDPVEAGVIDPVAVKQDAIESAADAAVMLLRIDDVISAS